MNQGRRIVSVFGNVCGLAAALGQLEALGLRDVAVYSPVGLPALEHLLPKRGSKIRFLVLAAGITGCLCAFWMCIGSALIYGLIVGGKWPAAVLPYCVIAFELTVLFGGLTALVSIIGLARLRPRVLPVEYHPSFGQDRFGLCVGCADGQAASLVGLLREAGAEDVYERG